VKSLSTELSELFRRDLTRLMQELAAFSDDDALWRSAPGIRNSAGNLALHLEGNLLEYVGRQLGGTPYRRQREREFRSRAVPASELVRRIDAVRELVPGIVARLSGAELESDFPEMVFGAPTSTQQVLISLHGHLNYHLGQIDYLRRFLGQGEAIEFAGL
jgi:hypothetical protein